MIRCRRCQGSGWYLLSLGVEFDGSARDGIGCGYRINDQSTAWDMQMQNGFKDGLGAVGHDLVYLNAGDYLQCWVFQNGGDSLTIMGDGADRTHAAMSLLIAA